MAENGSPELVKSIPDVRIEPDQEFEFNLRTVGTVFFGYDVGGSGLDVSHNYFATNVRLFKHWDNVAFGDNTIVSRDADHMIHFDEVPDPSSLDSYRWDDNVYVTNSKRPFVFDLEKTWVQWREQTGFDLASKLLLQPTENAVFVRPNNYNPGRGHVVVYNWLRKDSVRVDLRDVVPTGAKCVVKHALKSGDDETAWEGVYAGGVVELPMKSILSPEPIGFEGQPLELDREFAVFVVRCEDLPTETDGNSFFVSTSGSASNNGTRKYPWDLATALAHPDAVQPGDTIWIVGGTYNACGTSELKGLPEKPIHVRALPGHEVKLDFDRAKTGQSKLLSLAGEHTHYFGLEVLSSSPQSRRTAQPGSWPTNVKRGNLNITGDHIKLINCSIHDLNNGIGYFAAGDGGEVHGCLIYNNGWIGPDRAHGHAIYSQNDGTLRSFSDNIVFNQFRNGIKVYGSEQAKLRNYRIRGNVLFNNGGARGEGFTGTFQLLVGGGSLAEDIEVVDNHSYVGRSYFQDTDPNDSLTYRANLTDGGALPEWLTLHGTEGFFEGTPTASDRGQLEIEVTATDESGNSVSDTFVVSVGDSRSIESEVSE